MTALDAGPAEARWPLLTLVEQLASVGSEVERAMYWGRKGRPEERKHAARRAVELLDLVIADPRHQSSLSELRRLQEGLLDHFMGSNELGSSDLGWHTYFNTFGVAAAMERENARGL